MLRFYDGHNNLLFRGSRKESDKTGDDKEEGTWAM
jgi:hypothetical protein